MTSDVQSICCGTHKSMRALQSQTQKLRPSSDGEISLKGMGELSWATLPAFHQSGRFRAPSLLRTCGAILQISEKPGSRAHANVCEESQARRERPCTAGTAARSSCCEQVVQVGPHIWDEDSSDSCHGIPAVDQLCLLVPASSGWFHFTMLAEES